MKTRIIQTDANGRAYEFLVGLLDDDDKRYRQADTFFAYGTRGCKLEGFYFQEGSDITFEYFCEKLGYGTKPQATEHNYLWVGYTALWVLLNSRRLKTCNILKWSFVLRDRITRENTVLEGITMKPDCPRYLETLHQGMLQYQAYAYLHLFRNLLQSIEKEIA